MPSNLPGSIKDIHHNEPPKEDVEAHTRRVAKENPTNPDEMSEQEEEAWNYIIQLRECLKGNSNN